MAATKTNRDADAADVEQVKERLKRQRTCPEKDSFLSRKRGRRTYGFIQNLRLYFTTPLNLPEGET